MRINYFFFFWKYQEARCLAVAPTKVMPWLITEKLRAVPQVTAQRPSSSTRIHRDQLVLHSDIAIVSVLDAEPPNIYSIQLRTLYLQGRHLQKPSPRSMRTSRHRGQAISDFTQSQLFGPGPRRQSVREASRLSAPCPPFLNTLLIDSVKTRQLTDRCVTEEAPRHRWRSQQ